MDMIGQTISHYKILEKLGEGGMGVVYKAHDTTLDRDVALKFLPRDVSLSEDERTRFIHEAKAASALEHPNICTIHEVGETPEGQMYIVMGYYEGISLSRKVEKGPLDVPEAVWIAIQIAEGLQAAHEKGIVHRDIKSSNIIVSGKGQVRILDFGLARKKGLSKLTKTGTTVGTASYMSPEQARGESIDHRTDIWSLGVILYEMVTGGLPFRGEHEAAILYSVVNEEPQPIQAVVPEVSPELMHILRWALEKDPKERYQSAADLLIDLRRLKKDTSRTGFPPVSGVEKRLSFPRNKIIVAAGVLVLLCVAGYLYLFKKGAEINPNFTQRTIQVPFKKVSSPAVSPDGKYLVFAAEVSKDKWSLFVVSTKGGEPRQLTQDTNLNHYAFPNISPDGEHIVYSRGDEYDLCVVPFIGGTSIKISRGMLGKWSPDGKRIGYMLHRANTPRAAASKSGMAEFWTINPDGSDDRLEFIDSASAKRAIPGFSFAWSPDSRSIALVRPLSGPACDIVLYDLQTHKETTVLHDSTTKDEIAWASNGQIIYSSITGEGMNLWTVSSRGGSPLQITRGSNFEMDIPTISADARLIAFQQYGNIVHLRLARLDGSNTNYEVTTDEKYYYWPSVSPDGNSIAYNAKLGEYEAISHLFVINRDGTKRHQLTSGDTYDDVPMWSPDGKFISYNSTKKNETADSTKVYVVNMEKDEPPRLIHPGRNNGWSDSASLEVNYQNRYWRVFLDGRTPQRCSDDSIYAISVLDGKNILFRDQRKKSDNLWKVCRAEDWDGKGPAKSWAIWKGAVHGVVRNRGIYVFKNENELLRISFLDGRQEKIPATFPGINLSGYRIGLTRDGMWMCYKTDELKSKLGVIEDLFK